MHNVSQQEFVVPIPSPINDKRVESNKEAARSLITSGALAVIIGISLFLGVFFAKAGGPPVPIEHIERSPHCPTEDSCKPEYHNGNGTGYWTIEEVTP